MKLLRICKPFVNFLIVVVVFGIGGVLLAEIHPPAGEVRPYTAGDHARHDHTGRFTLEEWTYVLEASSGDVYFISYYYSNLWFLSPFCGVEISWTKQGTKPYLYGKKSKARLFKESAGAERMDFGPGNWMEGVPPKRHRIYASSDWREGIAIDVSFDKMWPGFIVGDGMFRVGSDGKLGALGMSGIPRARFKGTVSVGEDVQKIKGWAHMDRGFYQTLPTLLFDRRHSVNARFKDRSVYFMRWETVPHMGGDAASLLAVIGEKGVEGVWTDVTTSWPSRRKDLGCDFPMSFLVTGEGLRFGGKSLKPLQIWSLTDLVSRFTEVAIRAALGNIPVIVRSHALVELERMINGRKRRVKGTSVQRIDCSAK